MKDEGRRMNSPANDDLRQRTRAFALRIVRMSVAMPKTKEGHVLGQQVLKSGTSVGANYREASRARSKAEFIAKIGDCLKEADETLFWLEVISESKTLPARRLQPLVKETDELLAILTTIHKRSKDN
jgi:four helix bundle protein